MKGLILASLLALSLSAFGAPKAEVTDISVYPIYEADVTLSYSRAEIMKTIAISKKEVRGMSVYINGKLKVPATVDGYTVKSAIITENVELRDGKCGLSLNNGTESSKIYAYIYGLKDEDLIVTGGNRSLASSGLQKLTECMNTNIMTNSSDDMIAVKFKMELVDRR